MSEEKDITAILSKYKKIYFMSYNFILFFTVTNSKHYIFLKIMYYTFYQSFVKYKLLEFPLDCDFEKEHSTTLFMLYKNNTDQEQIENKNSFKGILKHVESPKKKCVTFDLPPIKEDVNQLSKEDTTQPLHMVSPLRKYLHPTLFSGLIDPRHPDK